MRVLYRRARGNTALATCGRQVRFLLSFLSMRREVVEESKFAIVEIIDAAENDAEEVRRRLSSLSLSLSLYRNTTS